MDDKTKHHGIYRGKVLDNADPDMLGRVKAEIYPMMIGTETASASLAGATPGIVTEALPWAVPAFSLVEGSAEGLGFVSIPRVGSTLFFFFENGSIYQPVYFASAPDAVHGLPSEIRANYPNKKVLKTQGGFIIELDDSSGNEALTVTHPAGAVLSILPDGGVTVSSPADVVVAASGEVNVTASKINLN